MRNYKVIPLKSANGIQRDGTPYFSQAYINGQWCRFYEGQPRKIGGYVATDTGTTEAAKNMFVVEKDQSIDLYIGRASSLSVLNINEDGTAGVEIDRTPTSGFVSNANNIWRFDLFIQTVGISSTPVTYIVAQVSPNGNDISGTTEGPIFFGDINDTAPLVQILDTMGDPVLCSGGVVFSTPVMVAYGNNGLFRWCEPGDITQWAPLSAPTDDSGFAVAGNTKLIKGALTRSGATSSILFWSLNSLERSVWIPSSGAGVPNTFGSSTVQDNISILSADSIINYKQMFFWAGTDQFYFYNGIVQPLKNTMNNDWFYQNINLTVREKVWGLAIPRYKELWWFYARRTADDPNPLVPNAAVIFSEEENCWYDTYINRGCGVQATSTYPFPIMADTKTVQVLTSHGAIYTYPIWTHEQGVNRVLNNEVSAIDSYFETHLIDSWTSDPLNTNFLRNRRIAPDFVQIGNMYVTINTQQYPNSPVIPDGPYSFTGVDYSTTPPTYPDQPFIDFSSQSPIISFLFRSNEVDGFYQGGKILYFFEKGDTLK